LNYIHSSRMGQYLHSRREPLLWLIIVLLLGLTCGCGIWDSCFTPSAELPNPTWIVGILPHFYIFSLTPGNYPTFPRKSYHFELRVMHVYVLYSLRVTVIAAEWFSCNSSCKTATDVSSSTHTSSKHLIINLLLSAVSVRYSSCLDWLATTS